jgi:phosphohistidine phosphatase SixA
MADASRVWKGIMRHGQAFRPGMDSEKRARGSSLTTRGFSEALAVAHRFAETVREEGIDPTDVTIVCAPTPEAKATAAALTAQLEGSADPVPLKVLDPVDWAPHADEDARARWKKIDAEIKRLDRPSRAAVVVGHDPQVSWLLHDLIKQGGRGQRGAGPLPLARGELAMLAADRGGPLELRWVLSPSDEKVIEQLQAKIKSKMDSAKLLGAFLTAVLVFAARELAAAADPPVWYPWIAGLGLVLLATATAAYFVTMFKYDVLLMPVRFWPSPRSSTGSTRLPHGFVVRPPSSAAWVLYQNMMRVWFNAFIPATLLGGAGAIAVTVALAQPYRFWWLAVALSIAALLAVTWFVWLKATPNLGVSD